MRRFKTNSIFARPFISFLLMIMPVVIIGTVMSMWGTPFANRQVIVA